MPVTICKRCGQAYHTNVMHLCGVPVVADVPIAEDGETDGAWELLRRLDRIDKDLEQIRAEIKKLLRDAHP